MHELSLIKNLIEKLESIVREQNGKRVASVKVRCGAFSHMSEDHFREHFIEAAAGTVAEGARLEVEISTDEADPHAREVLLQGVEVEV